MTSWQDYIKTAQNMEIPYQFAVDWWTSPHLRPRIDWQGPEEFFRVQWQQIQPQEEEFKLWSFISWADKCGIPTGVAYGLWWKFKILGNMPMSTYSWTAKLVKLGWKWLQEKEPARLKEPRLISQEELQRLLEVSISTAARAATRRTEVNDAFALESGFPASQVSSISETTKAAQNASQRKETVNAQNDQEKANPSQVQYEEDVPF